MGELTVRTPCDVRCGDEGVDAAGRAVGVHMYVRCMAAARSVLRVCGSYDTAGTAACVGMSGSGCPMAAPSTVLHVLSRVCT